MSHFTVLVIGEDIERQLQPFHQYECTGIMDEYVIDVDRTDEVNEWMNERVYFGKTKSGGVWDYKYNEDAAKECLVNYKHDSRITYFQIAGLDIDEEVRDYHGYTRRGNQWIDKTNPNKKWDWWVVGGRWTGMLKLKDGQSAVIGSPGLMTPAAPTGYCDSALKRDVDFVGMRAIAAEKAGKEWDSVRLQIKINDGFETWNEVRSRIADIKEARTVYTSQAEVSQFEKLHNNPFHSIDNFLCSRECYVEDAVNGIMVTFAIVKDGKWAEKGKMGWWATVSDAKDQNDWNSEFWMVLDSISDDTRITVVDCHI